MQPGCYSRSRVILQQFVKEVWRLTDTEGPTVKLRVFSLDPYAPKTSLGQSYLRALLPLKASQALNPTAQSSQAPMSSDTWTCTSAAAHHPILTAVGKLAGGDFASW